MLSDAHKKAALDHLNEICPDTFDEGEFGPWKFTNLKKEDKTYTLVFENAEGVDGVSFDYDGAPVDDAGSIVDDWFEGVNEAILEWEQDAF